VIDFDERDGVTRAEALRTLRGAFCEAGVENPALDARLLVLAASDLSAADLIREPEQALRADDLRRLATMTKRRIAREPVSRILGEREFWGLPLTISPAALDPRPETETLVEAALTVFALRRGEPLRILDIGAGSGAVLCALLNELPKAFGFALEISLPAAKVARDNLSRFGFGGRSSVVVGDWLTALKGRFDIIVSNPPYIASGAIAALSPEVRDYDPVGALDGGFDGLDAYRAIGMALGRLVEPNNGAFFLEVGAGQAESVAAIVAQAGLGALTAHRDLSGCDRVVAGRLLPAAEFALSKDATWRNAKKRLVLRSESSSPRSPSESRIAAGPVSACVAPAPSNARD
jgi:release factor glutamine methyltransferase